MRAKAGTASRQPASRLPAHPASRPAEALIIGAGPAGLAAAHELARAGVEASILERGPAVGTSWRARHDDLRLNTIRWLSELPGLRMPRRYGRWVTRDDYVAYLETYVRGNAIPVEYGVEVHRADRIGGAWRLETSCGARYARHVVVATGPHLVPWVPNWPGASLYAGELRHVASARLGDYAGRDVLVVGGGNSGVEWSEHLVRRGARTIWLSVRRPPNLLPREIAGVPLHPLAVAVDGLPMWLRDLSARLLRRIVLGDLSSHGIATPREGPYRTLAETGVAVAIDTGFSAYVRRGRIRTVPQIEYFTAREVVLTDGSRLSPDAVVAATGYRTGLERLVGHLGVLGPDGRPGVARDRRSYPGLWFIGFTAAIGGTLRLHGREARVIACRIGRELPGRQARSAGNPSRSVAALSIRQPRAVP